MNEMINLDDRLLDRLDDRQMWLLLHIVKRINKDGVCWPSMEQILKDTKWKDERTVKRVRDDLVGLGVIKVTSRMRQTGGQTSNLYSLETDQIGVFVTAKRLQEMQGPGVHEMGGRPLQTLGGPGVHEMGGEVLAKEVLGIEVLTKEGSESEKIPLPVPENQTALRWGDGSQTRLEKALQAIKDHIAQDPARLPALCQQARNRCNERGFWDEIGEYLRHHADNFQIMQNPIKALTSGPGNFVSWLSKPWCRDKYAALQPEQPRRRETPAPRPQRERITPEEVEALRQKYLR